MKAQRHKVINASISSLPLKKRVRIILTRDLPKGDDDTLSEKLCAFVPLCLRLYCEIRPPSGGNTKPGPQDPDSLPL